jgi:hypothetical protein
MLMGNSGSRSVPVAGQNVPVAAVPNMIAHFAQQAAAEWEEAYGIPESETLEGLSPAADAAERAEALAQAIATEAFTRIAGESTEQTGELWDLETVEAEVDVLEGAYAADYDPVYVR